MGVAIRYAISLFVNSEFHIGCQTAAPLYKYVLVKRSGQTTRGRAVRPFMLSQLFSLQRKYTSPHGFFDVPWLCQICERAKTELESARKGSRFLYLSAKLKISRPYFTLLVCKLQFLCCNSTGLVPLVNSVHLVQEIGTNKLCVLCICVKDSSKKNWTFVYSSYCLCLVDALYCFTLKGHTRSDIEVAILKISLLATKGKHNYATSTRQTAVCLVCS